MEKNNRTMGDHLLKLVIFSLIVVVNTHQAQGHDGGVSLKLNVTGTVGVQAGDVNANVSLTFIANATETGAVCLDGSAGGYYFDPGFGDGVNSWIIYLNGGGWCGSDGGCQAKVSNGGSSNQSLKMITFGQLHSRDHTTNPDFYNWNRVQVVYCDGSSFMGNADHSVVESRGARIFDAVMNEFFHKGIANATNVILTGGSAGGLATLLHCDGFRALFPSSVRVKCVIDSGFFLHAPQLYGAEYRANNYATIAAYHGFTDKLPATCRSKMNASRCIFPEYMIRDIQTPLFLVEAKFDWYQLHMNQFTDDKIFKNCTDDVTLCSPSHFETMKEYGVALTKSLQEIRDTSPSIGMFVHPCFRHGHFYDNLGWDASYKLKNKTIAQAIGDWYNERDCSTFQEIDTEHEYPLNRDCTEIPSI